MSKVLTHYPVQEADPNEYIMVGNRAHMVNG